MGCQRNYISIIIFTLFLGVIFMGNNSCKKITNPNSNEGSKDTIRYDFLKTRIFVQFVDAVTYQNITTEVGEVFSVEIVGKSYEAVADIIGSRKEKYYPKNGFITFGIFQEFVPSINSPIRFTIATSLTNHYPASKEIIITNDGDYYVKIPIINMDLPPDNVSITQLSNVGNLYKGIVHDDIIIATENGEAQITIPAGTELTAEDNSYLSGSLNITLIHHSNDNDMSMATIQGGISSSILKNTYSSKVLFYPANVIDFKIFDIDGKEAYYVEKKMIKVTTVIPDNAYNPNTASNYKLGDQIEVFSYLPDTGLWNYDNEVTITSGGSGLVVAASVTGLHSYNISNYKSVSCNEGLSFKLTGDCPECGSLLVEGIMRKQADDSFITGVSIAATWNETSYFPYRTGINNVYIDWAESSNCNTCIVNPAYSPLSIIDMCSHPQVYLSLIDNGFATTSIMANFSGKCSSDTNFIILPSFGIWVRQPDSPCWQWNSMINGSAQICNLVQGETYILGTYFDDMWQEWTIIVDDQEEYNFKIEFSGSVCHDVFGILKGGDDS